ncbi:MAG: C25 family peptidase propeptide domain-containing protein, partial [Candidatus Cloacimonadaceae bacterium]
MKKMLIILALLLSLALLTAEQITVGADSNEIRLLQAQPENMVLELNFANFERESLQIDGQTYYDLSVKNGGLTLERGLPQLPVMAASVIIPNTAKMQLEILSSEYVDLDMKVAPSKGNLTRDIDPATVPHSFGSFYQSDGFWPASQAELSEPFILRDYRGITVRFTPFSYFPAEGKLRVFTNIKVALSSNGTDLTNSLSTSKNRHSKEFEGIYQNMFLNFNTSKYTSLAEEGRILVIKHSMF